LFLTVALGLVATWTPGGCNNPVLCTLADEDERSLVIAWQTSLEGAVGALGPIIFSLLLTNVYEIDQTCLEDPTDPCAVGPAIGRALGWVSCVPWGICGLMYTLLHYTYPRDLEASIKDREEQFNEQREKAGVEF
jgi:hypothetical protein